MALLHFQAEKIDFSLTLIWILLIWCFIIVLLFLLPIRAFFLTLLDCFVVVLSSPVGTIYYAPNFLLDTDRTTSFWSSFCQRCTLHDSSVSPTKKIDYYTLNKDWTIFPLWWKWDLSYWDVESKTKSGNGCGNWTQNRPRNRTNGKPLLGNTIYTFLKPFSTL